MPQPTADKHSQVPLFPTLHLAEATPKSGALTEDDDSFTVSTQTSPPPAIGPYEILVELGRGGMGVVYKAWDVEQGRRVALKVMLRGYECSAEEVARFRAEAEVGRRLQHPNIVAIFDVGHADGLEYFAMELIEGQTLEERSIQRALTPRQAALYTLKVARAMQHAHERGILHRDLKPSNILIDATDEPHIVDFGLAKRVGAANQTAVGELLGTPEFMPPEQAGGHARDVGPSSDVYGLGAILYQLLTGQPPFSGRNTMQTLKKVLQERPQAPHLLRDGIDRNLEAICLRCLEKRPTDRYASAAALAADLQRYLDGRRVQARDFGFLRQLARTLSAGGHDEFRGWASVFLPLSAVLLISQIAISLLTLAEPRHFAVWTVGAHLCELATIAGTVLVFGPRGLLPRTERGRQLISVWGGYLAACVVGGVIVGEGWGPSDATAELRVYPFWALLAGLAFFGVGVSHWGCCYLFGVGFFAIALTARFVPWSGPITFGLWWAICLNLISWHLYRLAADAADSVDLGQPSKCG